MKIKSPTDGSNLNEMLVLVQETLYVFRQVFVYMAMILTSQLAQLKLHLLGLLVSVEKKKVVILARQLLINI